ncbi:hypothetical protein JJB11_20930 [Ramlibacter ginsenosidimutans]|uniref:Uncharacterized protein n=1 Tax=Ramlibacter ginsenosidimutans TaxID=502333 RepID=A0A934TW75_9BURK|nr:hypothetical protein [Ramlibacter ginsenosidimutans]MBK6008573.1 hypothetical protein [Ramlibacter ginsenosidimutans]
MMMREATSTMGPTAGRSPGKSGFIAATLYFLAGALILCAAAFWNGQPFLYPDTPTYVRGAEMGAAKLVGQGRLPTWLPGEGQQDAGAPATLPPRQLAPVTSLDQKVVLAGRSVYYGALVYLGFLTGGLWLTVLVQAAMVVGLLYLLLRRVWGLGRGACLAIVAALAVVSPLGLYTGLLMPDLFAGLAILCFGLLCVYWDRLTRGERWAVGGLLLFGLVAHTSHVAVAAGLLVLALAARLMRRWRALPLAGLVAVAVCLLGAVAAEKAFDFAVQKVVGAPPLRLPHPMARLIDEGPGTTFLRSHCPDAGYAACQFVGNYPTYWEDFLFSADPAKGAFALADPATKRRISDEQMRFLFDVLRDQPVAVLKGFATDTLRQLTHFRVDVAGVSTPQLRMYQGRVPPSVYAGLLASRTLDAPGTDDVITVTTYASVIAALLLAVALAGRRLQGSARAAGPALPQRFGEFASVVVAGILVNAVVCATLASPLDRFQSRVMWLLPLLALAGVAFALQARRSGAAAPVAPSFLSPTLQGAPHDA